MTENEKILDVLLQRVGSISLPVHRSRWEKKITGWAWNLYVWAFSLIPIAIFMAVWGGKLLPVVILTFIQLLAVLAMAVSLLEVIPIVLVWRSKERHGILARGEAVRKLADDLKRQFPEFREWASFLEDVSIWREDRSYRLGFFIAMAGLGFSVYAAELSSSSFSCSPESPFNALIGAFIHGEMTVCWWKRVGMTFFVGSMAGAFGAYLQVRRAGLMVEVLKRICRVSGPRQSEPLGSM